MLGVVGAALLVLLAWASVGDGPPIRYVDLPVVEVEIGSAPLPPSAAGPPTAMAPMRVAVLVTELGLAAAALERALALPAVTGLVLSPYAPELPRVLADVRAAGHEPWLEAPLAAVDAGLVDYGPMALSPDQPAAAMQQKVSWLLERAAGMAGLAAEAGAFAPEPRSLLPLLAPLAPARLAFVELGARSLAPSAAENGLRFAASGGPIDVVPEAAAIDSELARVMRRAPGDDDVIVWGRALPVTLDRLGAWMGRLEAAEVELVAPGILTAGVAERGGAAAP